MRFVHDITKTGPPSPFSRLRGAALLLLAVGTALALVLPAQAEPGHGPHGRRGPDGWIERHAEELDLDDATLEKIEALIDGSREQARAIREEHRAARDEMHALLDLDTPDRAAVMSQAEVLGAIDTRKHQHRLATMLDIRALLTPEQRAKLGDLKDEMREQRRHHMRHGKHHSKHPGECGGKCDGRCHDGEPGEAQPSADDDAASAT
jgi:Spy/CpxP family protein refolding chaperone